MRRMHACAQVLRESVVEGAAREQRLQAEVKSLLAQVVQQSLAAPVQAAAPATQAQQVAAAQAEPRAE